MKHLIFENFKPLNIDNDYIIRACSVDFSFDGKIYNIKDLHDEFSRDLAKSDSLFREKRLRTAGIITFKGIDEHGIPSFEISDKVDGYTLALCCLKSSKEYGNKNVGDEIIIEGNYLITNENYGIVLKRCNLIK